MPSLSEQIYNLLESFDYSSNPEERIRILRGILGRLSSIMYGSKKEEEYSEVFRRLKLRLRELRERIAENEKMEPKLWQYLMNSLEEIRDELERIAVKENVIGK